MMSTMKYSIKDLPVSMQALTEAEVGKVIGGVMMDEYGRGCTERNLPPYFIPLGPYPIRPLP